MSDSTRYAAIVARAQARHGLTDRESEVLSLVLHGRSYKAIALDLGIKRNTVKTHATTVIAKLGVAGRAGLTKFLIDGSAD